jgi:hypothetical protein
MVGFSGCALAADSYLIGGTQSKLYCAYDYMRHCSAYRLGSKDLEKCMADVGPNLSKKCIQALVDDGYITKETVIDKAKERGIVVEDTQEGLKVVEGVTPTEEPKKIEEPAPATVEPPAVEVSSTATAEPEITVEPPKAEVVEQPKKDTWVSRSKASIKKKFKDVTEKVKKAVSGKTPAKRPAQPQKATKEKYKPPHSFTEHYTKHVDGSNIVPEGYNADYGKRDTRPHGYVKIKETGWTEMMNNRYSGEGNFEGYGANFGRR